MPAARKTLTLSMPADACRCLQLAKPSHCQCLQLPADAYSSQDPHTANACRCLQLPKVCMELHATTPPPLRKTCRLPHGTGDKTELERDWPVSFEFVLTVMRFFENHLFPMKCIATVGFPASSWYPEIILTAPVCPRSGGVSRNHLDGHPV